MKKSLTVLLVIFACNSHQQKEPPSFGHEAVEGQVYVVPKDSIVEPKVNPVGKPWVVRAGKPKVVAVSSNVHPAGKPKLVLADTIIHIPGQDSFAVPQTFPAMGKTILAGSPKVIVAKDALAKDQNLYNFSSFGEMQGLINQAIFSILEDKKGNLWIGTYGGGVCKYDGVSFTHFTEKEGLGSNIVVSILEDKSENLWFGTLGGGMCKYDGKTFTRFTDKDGLGSNFVNCMIEDHKGNLWIGTTGGVTKYEPADKQSNVSETQANHLSLQGNFTRFTKKEGLFQQNVMAILEDKNGNLWFGNYAGGICKYNGKSFTLFAEKKGLSFDIVKAIAEDKRGGIWFGTWANGAYKFDGKYFTHFTTKEGLSNNNVKSILEDENGSIWFGTEGGGISLYDPGDGSTPHPSTFTYFTVKEGLSNDIVNTIIKDKNGILWIGTYNNLNKYMGKSITHFTEKDGLTGSIKCVLESKNGNLWFGGSDGLSMYDGKFFTHFTEKEGLYQDNVNTLLEDKNGNLWIGSYAGATKYDGKYFTHFIGGTGLGWGNVHSIKEDKSGNLWFGMYGRGVTKYDGKSFTHFTEKQGLNSNWVWTILEDKNDNFWFGTSDRGPTKYEPFRRNAGFAHFTEKEDISRKDVRSILEDKKGNFWFGTGGSGVMCYNPLSHKFSHYTKEQGLISDFVIGILEDKNNNLWFSTSSGISKLDKNYLQKIEDHKNNPTNQSNNYEAPILFKNLDYADGFHGISASQNAICEDKNGTIWVGTNDRLTALHPAEEIPDSMPPNIQLSGLALFNEYISWQYLEKKRDTNIVLGNGDRIHDLRFEEVNKWYSVPQQLSLAYDNNHLTFRYVGITIHSPEKVWYQYMLEGLEKNWSGLTDRTEISYNNLSYGKYTFKVKAVNSEGYWSKELNYPFRIRPPWWFSTWAYTFYGFCLIAGLFLTDRFQRKRILEKERALTRDKEFELAENELQIQKLETEKTKAQFLQRTTELEMQALRAQMNPHFIFNCLTSINRFILKNESEEASDYLTKFSRLIRMVLTNSKKELISLDDELEMLRLYLEMERLRFKYSFDYNIGFKNEIEPENIFIPPLLLQPFAENAIWHGIMNKEEPGHLSVLLSIEKNLLTCIIEDNGVGRRIAAILKSKSAEKKKSLGLQITKERLSLLNKGSNETAFFEMEDLYDDKGNANGTRVILKIRLPEKSEERFLIS